MSTAASKIQKTESDGLATVQTLPANIKIEMGAEVLPVLSEKALNTFESKNRVK